MAPVLDLAGVAKSFGGLQVLRDVTLSVAAGETVGLIGPNGAGKSVLFDIITGITRPTQGEIRISGRLTRGMQPWDVARLGLGRTFQDQKLFSGMTVGEHLYLAARRNRGLPVAGWAGQVARYMGLTDQLPAQPAALGIDGQRRLAIGRAVALRPTLLLLDEVMAGLNAEERQQLVGLLRSLPEFLGYPLSMVVVEHVLPVIDALCPRVVVLDAGSIIFAGTPGAARRDPGVVTAYLGSRPAGTRAGGRANPHGHGGPAGLEQGGSA